ncbi:Threonine synthase-like 1 [Mortierella sp. NVP85]|nr:Threonine synthase-like 1 [Mortierella sp. NVP85]
MATATASKTASLYTRTTQQRFLGSLPQRTCTRWNMVDPTKTIRSIHALEGLGSGSGSGSLLAAAGSRSGPISLFSLRSYHVTTRVLDQQRKPLHSHGSDHTSESKTEDPATPSPSLSLDDDGIQHQHQNPIPPNTDPKARILIGFTCTVCNNRSHKTMSKHAYNHGVVIMQCDHCKNRHLIADHLGWFRNGGVTVEDLVKERGETVQKLSRDYQLVKDGEISGSEENSVGTDAAAAAAVDSSAAAAEGAKKPKTELELALEKAAEGMLEWIPKEILQQEEERMKKSRASLDPSKQKE